MLKALLIHRLAPYLGASSASLLVLAGCGAPTPEVDPGAWTSSDLAGGEEVIGGARQPFVNGGDDRLEYFELMEAGQRVALERFAVVLMTDGAAAAVTSGYLDLLPTWADVNQLCPGEPFFEQPAAAFCSGVLLDWNLVLTSGHCVDALPLEELRVVFDYYYRAEGELAAGEEDVFRVRRVVSARRDPATPDDAAERLDYAWLELEQPALPPHRPAATYTRSRGADPSERVISIGAGGGVPLKWDGGGRVRELREGFDDYLVADTDTSQGSSGGGLFDERLAVLGSLARGAPDFVVTEAGCYVTARESDPAAAQEQFTYVHRAVEGLCAAGSSSVLCNEDCAEPCDAGAVELLSPAPEEVPGESSGCALAPGSSPAESRSARAVAAVCLIAASVLARRARRFAARHPIGREPRQPG